MKILFPNRFPILASLSLLLALNSCNPSQSLPGFDAVAWKEDRNACNGKRAEPVKGLRNNLDLLKGLSEPELNATLGTPDKINLGTRNLKSYWYFTKPGSQCEDKPGMIGPYLTVRFNAVGLSYEVLLPNE